MKTVLSLFSGIGGLCHHGIEASGLSHKFQVRQFVEISTYSQSRLRDEQPGIPIHTDITTYECEYHQFDIICGGFPCAGTSCAGDREGLNDPRSGLWNRMFEIIKECHPSFVLIENPKGLLHNGLAQIIQELDAIRYMGEWNCVAASNLGLPHRRERVFIIAYPNGIFKQIFPTAWSKQIREDIALLRIAHQPREYKSGLLEVGYKRQGSREQGAGGKTETELVLRRSSSALEGWGTHVPLCSSSMELGLLPLLPAPFPSAYKGDGIPIGVPKGIKGNYNARRAYGLSCSPLQAAIAWRRIDYLVGLMESNCHETLTD